MSAADEIPYQLRPNKYIDRELFLELLSRLVPTFGAEEYAYISMGGPHLVDHKFAYRRLGIDALYSFADNQEVIDRQKCNRPIDDVRCIVSTSGEVAQSIEGILNDLNRKHSIVWFDFTSGWARKSQVAELSRLARDLIPGDIVRVTMNANLQNLATAEQWRDDQAEYEKLVNDNPDGGIDEKPFLATFGDFCRKKLEEQLQELCPTEPKKIDGSNFPEALYLALRAALDESADESKEFKTLLLTKYRDGQTMMSATFFCVQSGAPTPSNISDWKFLSQQWSDRIDVVSPNLSMKERFLIDEVLSEKPEKIVDNVGFLSTSDRKGSEAQVASYKKLHRMYPAFMNVDAS